MRGAKPLRASRLAGQSAVHRVLYAVERYSLRPGGFLVPASGFRRTTMDLSLRDVAIVGRLHQAVDLSQARAGRLQRRACARGEDKLRVTEELQSLGVGRWDSGRGDVAKTSRGREPPRRSGVDVLVNNAGGRRPGSDDADWQADTISTSWPPCALARRRRHTCGTGRRQHRPIVHLGPRGGVGADCNAYKAAMVKPPEPGPAQPFGIRVNSVAPGRSRSRAAPGTAVSSPTPRA
jgi:hypothetical protein